MLAIEINIRRSLPICAVWPVKENFKSWKTKHPFEWLWGECLRGRQAMTERIISRNPQLEYYSIKRYRHPAKHSVTRFLFISGFCFSSLVGFVLKALRRESTCAEFVLALPLVIHKSFLAKTRPLHSIMCSILRLNNLWSMSSASEDWLRGKLTVFCRNVLIVKVYVTLQLRFFLHFKPLHGNSATSAKLPCQLYMFRNVLYKIIEKSILFLLQMPWWLQCHSPSLWAGKYHTLASRVCKWPTKPIGVVTFEVLHYVQLAMVHQIYFLLILN